MMGMFVKLALLISRLRTGTYQVKDMSGMFDGASSFNQPLGDWDVGSVKDMMGFFGAITL
jgi:surface protein